MSNATQRFVKSALNVIEKGLTYLGTIAIALGISATATWHVGKLFLGFLENEGFHKLIIDVLTLGHWFLMFAIPFNVTILAFSWCEESLRKSRG